MFTKKQVVLILLLIAVLFSSIIFVFQTTRSFELAVMVGFLCILLFGIAGRLVYGFNPAERYENLIKNWRGMKEKKEDFLGKYFACLEVDESLVLAKGEQVMMGPVEAVVETAGGPSYSLYPRDIIVTNQRIAIGFLNMLNPMEKKEIFGDYNLWFNEAARAGRSPSGKEFSDITNALGGEMVVKGAVLKTDGKMPKVEIKGKSVLLFTIVIYSPQAEKIMEILKRGNSMI